MRGRVAIAVLLAASMAACAGPSKARLNDLLGECRRHNRENVRLLKAAEKTCARLPEQGMGETEIGLGGF